VSFSIGLGDGALLEVSKDDIVLVSADGPLCVAASIAGYTTINFNRERFPE
jgi:hypothetical protein